ncbi:MAG: AMP-binding protein [Deltaproteobacteria bacterium]|nr:AMP-binding protein [Deltaproteobacteria bacterium]
MGLDEVNGLNLAQVIQFYGTDPKARDRTFLMYRDEDEALQRVSFAALYEKSLNYGAMIHQIREEKGKLEAPRFHVGFFMQNTPEVIYLLGGCAFTNSTLVGINNAQVGEKLSIDINKTDVEVVFADEVEQPKTGRTFVESLMDSHQRYGLGDLYPRYVISRREQAANHPPDVTTIEKRLDRCKGLDFTPVALDDDNAGFIIFTSGTTGAPKGIEVLWKKSMDVGLVMSTLLDYSETDVGYICMPLNHSNSLYINLLPALVNGARVLLRRRFSASKFLKDISEAGVTIWNSVGDPVNYVLGTVGYEADYSNLPLRTVVSTGTNAANREAFTRVFGLDIFSEAYGSTEVGAVAMVTADTPAYSVGRVNPGKDVRIVEEFTGRECEPAVVDQNGNITNFEKSVGEIVVSQETLGDSAFSGYYNLPRETAERVDGQGDYHMGDLGAIEQRDGERYVIFLGRTGADRLRTKGENFSATFVEEIILKYPGVNGAAVIGIPFVDSTENDNPIFVLELDDPGKFELHKFLSFSHREIPPYAQPGFIRLITELPRTETHKVRKSDLMQEFIERTPDKDADGHDVLYVVGPDGIKEFKTEDYRREMDRCTDSAVRARFQAVTKRQDIF